MNHSDSTLANTTLANTSAHILIVEDELRIADVLISYLNNNGFATTHVSNGNEAIPTLQQQVADKQAIDMVLLDVLLPGRDGLSLLKDIRQMWPQLPVLMVTARIEEIDRLLGLELGADDYICKPFSPREVVARIRSVLRRSQPATAPVMTGNKHSSPLHIDQDRFEARLNDALLNLTPKEFMLLATLAQAPGRVYTRAQLLQKLYDDDDVSDRVIDSHMKNLRRKLNQALPERELIQAIYGVGYKLSEG